MPLNPPGSPNISIIIMRVVLVNNCTAAGMPFTYSCLLNNVLFRQ